MMVRGKEYPMMLWWKRSSADGGNSACAEGYCPGWTADCNG